MSTRSFSFPRDEVPQAAAPWSAHSVAALALAAATLALPVLAACGSASTPPPAPRPPLTSTYDFGNAALHTSESRIVVELTNAGSSSTSVTVSQSGDSSFSIDAGVSCGASIPEGGSCPMVVTYSPQQAGSETAKLLINETGGTTDAQRIQLTGTGTALPAGGGMVSATDNPLVALYTYAPTGPGKVYVRFGTTPSYGKKTWAVSTPSNGDPVSLYVAGMQANTRYHLQATEDLSGGGTAQDQDRTFKTSSFPASILPHFTVTTASGATPQPGIELMSAIYSHTKGYLEAYATDLEGNIIWGYNYPNRYTKGSFATMVQPVKLMPNGNMVVVLSYSSNANLDSSDKIVKTPAGAMDLIREIDLAGDPVKQITLDQLNTEMTTAGYAIHLYDFSHDVTILPNGHWIVIATTIQSETGLTGEPSPVNVLGDVIIDLDTSLKPVWVWNEFDHLDLNRHPMNFPDWTHTNAVDYSPTDGNLLISIRHQNWLLKIDYDNGQGNGDILWRLGHQGDFTLENGSAPIDWNYAQHGPHFAGATTAGTFQITMMSNGDDRIDSAGDTCGPSTFACYTSIPIFNVDTTNKTATLAFQYDVPAADYSSWGGNAEVLANGDLEFDLCSEPKDSSGATTATVEEMAPTSSPRAIWTMHEVGSNLYRARRLPSLYPGVQW